MILNGQRKANPELMEQLQSIPGVHKVVNNQLWDSLYTQGVRGSNPLPPTIFESNTALMLTTERVEGKFPSTLLNLELRSVDYGA